MKKGAYISDIVNQGIIDGIFCIESSKILTTKNGDPYLALTLMDKTGSIEARLWDLPPNFTPPEQGSFLKVTAEVQTFRDNLQLKIIKIEPVSIEVTNPEEFLPVTSFDRKVLWNKIKHFIKSIKDPVLRPVLDWIFSDLGFKKAIYNAPAAKKVHHAYIGGLLEHTLGVTRLADKIVDMYDYLDRNLLISGALVHDIGKIKEFKYDSPPIDYTDEGRLIGHLVLGSNIVDEASKNVGISLNNPRIIALKHLILSHHGQREFGAVVEPMTEEAMVLYMVDDLDAKLNYLCALKKELDKTDNGRCWTSFQHLMGRYFFLSPLKEDIEEIEESHTNRKKEKDFFKNIQSTLWSLEDKKDDSD